MRNAVKFTELLNSDLLILSGRYIQIKQVPIHGGPICLMHANNAGWRIDYFVLSERMRPYLKDSVIYADVMGSDHCPVGLCWTAKKELGKINYVFDKRM